MDNEGGGGGGVDGDGVGTEVDVEVYRLAHNLLLMRVPPMKTGRVAPALPILRKEIDARSHCDCMASDG